MGRARRGGDVCWPSATGGGPFHGRWRNDDPKQEDGSGADGGRRSPASCPHRSRRRQPGAAPPPLRPHTPQPFPCLPCPRSSAWLRPQARRRRAVCECPWGWHLGARGGPGCLPNSHVRGPRWRWPLLPSLLLPLPPTFASFSRAWRAPLIGPRLGAARLPGPPPGRWGAACLCFKTLLLAARLWASCGEATPSLACRRPPWCHSCQASRPLQRRRQCCRSSGRDGARPTFKRPPRKPGRMPEGCALP